MTTAMILQQYFSPVVIFPDMVAMVVGLAFSSWVIRVISERLRLCKG